ncbi:UDP-N-acetylmuramoyl-L-alanine--D-glutamate ligase [Arcanobacterium ihumii]|uniref:UDP-N-acetylmuramoyl-L-alanine--D-glutamate ligase n=1 Tax=Arcanobacterium ihumii TaxID=2138162 RepID=UPI000F5243D2|nr:UDP-N-acetylmuramoyl-L-alanine--D-glutamate ligase [Arcanobacterium ihumii]
MSYSIPTLDYFVDRRIAVLGLGISGLASIDVLTSKTEAIVSAWDASEDAVQKFHDNVATDYTFAHPDPETLIAKLIDWKPEIVVIAPGFRQTGYEWKTLREANIEVWSEIELAWNLRARNTDGEFAPWLCITGTNGKTTTVTMLESILVEAGLRGKAIGNVGTPAVTEVSRTDDEAPRAFALELSSFQLATTMSMAPTSSVCLNIDDDHLEWHGSRNAYHDAKARIYENTQIACVYPVGDTAVQSMVDNADVQEGARAIGLTLGIPSLGQIGLVEDIAIDRAFGQRYSKEACVLFELSDLSHLMSADHIAPHLVKDALAATALARSIGIAPDVIAQGLRSYRIGAHRIETVAVIDGVSWIDDSKATNAHAARASLLGRSQQSVIWIVGGLAKGARFDELISDVEEVLAGVVVIGQDQEPWKSALREVSVPVRYIDVDDQNPMTSAVQQATELLTATTDTVLLAPASASMDQFDSYAHRGRMFSQAVEGMNLHASEEI